MFSIIIPSWNNLAYLKLCVESLRKHSTFSNEIIIHINEGVDGTLEWVKSQGLRYTHSHKNIGVCLSVNHLVAQSRHDWVLYMNDDMVAAPGWDTAFAKTIKDADTDLALIFGTLIQPDNGGNDLIIEQDFGRTPEMFDEEEFLNRCFDDARGDAEGAPMQPTLFHKKWWHMVGGYSLEFSPGMSSDDDLLMKYWVIGCRRFSAIGASRFYHFGMASTGRISHNKGSRTFVMKWGMAQREFYRNYMAPLRKVNREIGLVDCKVDALRPTLRGKLLRVVYTLKGGYPLGGLTVWDSQPGKCGLERSDTN